MQNKETWSEEFDKLYKQLGLHLGYKKKEQIVKLKSFIAKKLEEVREETAKQTEEACKQYIHDNSFKAGKLQALQEVRKEIERISTLYKKAKFGLDDEILRHILSHIDSLITR